MNTKRNCGVPAIICCFLLVAVSQFPVPGRCGQVLFKNPCVGKPEKWVYRDREKEGEWIIITEVSSYKTRNDRMEMIIISKPENRNSITTMTLAAETMKPIAITVRGEKEIVCEAVYRTSVVFIRYKALDKKKPRGGKKISNTNVTYDQRTLFWLLRGYPFNDPGIMEIDIVMPLGNRCSMKVRYLGREEITVPAGKFRAHKLEMEPNAILPFFSKGLKTYFWYSPGRTPMFLKYEHPNGGQIAELIKASFETTD